MTDLREAVARAINDVPCPQVVDGQPATESVCLALADAALRAIEAAGYVIAQQVDEIDFDENDRSFVVKSFLVEKGAVDAMVAAASPPLAKET